MRGLGRSIYSDTIKRGNGGLDNVRQCKMSDSEHTEKSGSKRAQQEIIKGVLAKFLVNEEYQRLICVGEGCGVGLELRWVERHMRKSHKLTKNMATRVKRGIRAANWGQVWGKYSMMMPVDGLRPQEGLAVYDGARCQYCHTFRARMAEEVERHSYELHGESRSWEKVRVQSWGGKGEIGDLYWIVDENKGRGCDEKKGLEVIGENCEGSEGWSEGLNQEESEGSWEEDKLDVWVVDDGSREEDELDEGVADDGSTWGRREVDERGYETKDDWIFMEQVG